MVGKKSGEIIEEEDEDIEEVDAFSPVMGPGEVEIVFAAPAVLPEVEAPVEVGAPVEVEAPVEAEEHE